MELIDSHKKQEVIDWARQIERLVQEHSPDTAEAINQEVKNFDEHKLTVAVVGMLKRGKSTFCNAFLGRSDDVLAPVGRFPTTGIISEFAFSETQEYANVVFHNGSSIKITYDEIRSYVMEDQNPENCKQVQKVEVYGKFNLDKEIKLVDMPGDESIHAYHSEIVYNYLPNADVVIFLSSASDPVTQNELSLLRKVQPTDMKKIFFVVNKADKCDENEIVEAVSHNRSTLNEAQIIVENDIYVISAKKAVDCSGNSMDFPKLLKDISTFLNRDRYKLWLQGFYGRIIALAAPIINDLRQQNEFAALDVAELEERIDSLLQQKKVMEVELKNGLEEFSDNWDAMLEAFEDSLPEVQKNSERLLVNEIEKKNILTFNNSIIEKMPEEISRTLESELQTVCGHLEKQAKDSLEKLERNCPQISKFFSNQAFNVTLNSSEHKIGSWIFTLLSGSTVYLTGSAIASAFAVGGTWGGTGVLGTVLAVIGKTTGIVAGSTTAVLLGPLFLISAVTTAVAVTGLTFSFVRKKQLQKKNLIAEIKREVQNAFDSIKMKRIPYLRQQKEVLIEQIQKQFDKTMQNMEKNLQDALSERRKNSVNNLLCSQRQAVVEEFETFKQQAVEDVEQ